jgi:hypothetical protein
VVKSAAAITSGVRLRQFAPAAEATIRSLGRSQPINRVIRREKVAGRKDDGPGGADWLPLVS